MKPMVDYLCEDANERMHSQMTRDCGMREFCETAFKDILQETAGFISRGKVEATTVKMYRERLEELKKRKQKNLNAAGVFQKLLIFLKNRSNLCALSRYIRTGKKEMKRET
ncbi:hypothetical protein [Methanosarcina horonobensis]|uniref:hypothetical protein n=1 Tax=Methanosarcina horonobensis TaxID=418008 RepID=UPI0022B90B51|nr:hypothetical protein [Methanosarcina horonobensis]